MGILDYGLKVTWITMKVGILSRSLENTSINWHDNGFTESPYFGIMVDETTDISTTTQLIIYIKYLAKSDDTDDGHGEYEPKIGYLDMGIPESGSAIHIKVIT